MSECKDCKIIPPKWSLNGERIVGYAIQHCEACTKAHKIREERDDLLEQKRAIGSSIYEIHSILVNDPLEADDARTFRESLHEISVAAEKAHGIAHELEISEGAIRIQASQINNLITERDALRKCVETQREAITDLLAEVDASRSLRKVNEIQAEIAALEPFAKDYDTERQSNDTCLAAGAHDALRWALGLAEESISEVLTKL